MGQHLFIQCFRVDLVAAGHHGQQRRGTAHLFHLLELGQQIVHIELVFHHPPGRGFGFLVVLDALRFLDEREHIAHAHDAAGHAGGIEGFQIFQLFAGALEVDGFAGDRQHREGCTAAGIAVGLGQHHTGDADLLVEGLGHVDGFLAGHGIHHQQRLVYLDGFLDANQLVHQRIIDLQTAGGIQDDDVIAMVPGMSHRLLGDEFRFFGAHGENRYPGLFTDDLQLLDGRRTVDVTGHQQRPASLAAVILAQLGGMGGFTVALQAAHHQNRLALILDVQVLRLVAAHELGQFLVDDLDDLLGGGQAFHDLLPHGALGNLRAEILGDFVVDVGFQQCHADFPHGRLDIGLVQLAFAAELFKYAVQALCQRFKGHRVPPACPAAPESAASRRYRCESAGQG